MSAYLDVNGFKERSIMPPEDVDRIVTAFPTFLTNRIAIASSEVNSKLRKRYVAPFAAPYPEVVLGWIADIVTPEMYERRGWNPGDAQSQNILDAAARARTQMQEAADAKEGLWDIPLREDSTADGIAKGEPLGCSEQDPYAWMHKQAEAVRGG